MTVPPGWDTRQLVALLAVVDTGTFSAAALRLGYTQSAVSQQVATLERAVGAPLLERPGGPRRVRLTAVGESLVVHARAVVARLHAAQADIAALLAGERGTLHVGLMQSVGTKVLPRLLRRFREEWPGVELAARETSAYAELAAGVESGRFDLSFAPLPVPDGPFAVRRVLADPFVCVAPAGAPEARLERSACGRSRGCRSSAYADPDLHDELVRRLRRTGHEPSFVFRSNDNPTIQGFVAAGLGYAVMPRLTVDEDDPEVALLSLSSALPRAAAGRRVARRPPAAAHGHPVRRAGGRGLRRARPAVGVTARRSGRVGGAQGSQGAGAVAGRQPSEIWRRPRPARPASVAARGAAVSAAACGARAGRAPAGGASSSAATAAPRPRRAAAPARGPARPARPRRCRCRRRPGASPSVEVAVPTRPSRAMS